MIGPTLHSRSPTVTPVGAVARGLVAGALGTAAMDAFLFARYRRDGGSSSALAWESSAGVTGWEEAPAPAHVGKRLVEGLFGIELPSTRARLVNNVMHWAYGIANGAQYGIVAESLPTPRIRYGLPFGATVWAGDYVILPWPSCTSRSGSTTSRRWPTISARTSFTGSPRRPR